MLPPFLERRTIRLLTPVTPRTGADLDERRSQQPRRQRMSNKTKRTGTATQRPATKRRRFRHDDRRAVDLFSGFGGLTRGIEAAGFTTIMAANHNAYKVEVHERNHPNAENRSTARRSSWRNLRRL